MQIEPSQKSLKSQLRKDLRARRAAIEDSLRDRWDAAIRQHIARHVARTRPAVVAAFLAFDGEPDLMPLLEKFDEGGVKLALPVIRDRPGKAVITFRRWIRGSKLHNNRYGIAEPAGTADVQLRDLDLVFVPSVGWDRHGGRLGMGASFYDRLFQPFAEQERPERLGIAYELQRVDRIPSEPWDVGLHAVVTEHGLFTCAD